MAINRFRRFMPQLDPTVYQYNAQEFIPDISGLRQVQQGLQTAFDASSRIPVPKHLLQDTDNVQNMYVQPLEQMRDGAVNAFKEGKLSDGIRALKDMQGRIFELKQPGGLYDQFEQNYNSYSEFNKRLKELHGKGVISGDKLTGLDRLSRSRFTGSFNEDGTYNPFSGIEAAKDVNLSEAGVKIAAGWKADKIASGALYLDPNTGTYLYSSSKTFVDPKEVKQHIFNALSNDPDSMAYLRQNAVLLGLSGQDATDYINMQLNEAADVAAAKEGFTQVDVDFHKNWELEQSRQHAFETDQMDRTATTGFFSVATGATPIELDKDGRVRIDVGSIGYKELLEMNPKLATVPTMGISGGKHTYADVGIDDLIRTDPEYAKRHAGLADAVSLLPRKRGKPDDPNYLESNAEYNRRVGDAYIKYAKNKGVRAVGYREYDDQQSERATNQLFGKDGAPGQFAHRAYTLMHNGREYPGTISPTKLMNIAGAKNHEEMRKKTSAVGEIEADNPFAPSGYVITFEAANGKGSYTAIASNTHIQDMNKQMPAYQLFKPTYDLSMSESGPVRWEYGRDPKDPNDPGYAWLNSKLVKYVDDNGDIQDELIIFQAQDTDENGMPTDWQPTGLTKEQFLSTNQNVQFTAPARTNPRLGQ